MENIVDVKPFIDELQRSKSDCYWKNSDEFGFGIPMGRIVNIMENHIRNPGSWAESEIQSVLKLMNGALRLALKSSNLSTIDKWISEYNQKKFQHGGN